MRYTRYDDKLSRYVVPCLHKPDGSRIEFYVHTIEEVRALGKGSTIVKPALHLVFGEVIDRLSELESLEEAYKRVLSLPNCNDCGHNLHNSCGHCPRPGEQVRINCPLWKTQEGGNR